MGELSILRIPVPVLHGAAELTERLTTLTDLLTRTEALWRARPFEQLPLPWEAEHPDLAGWLRRLAPEDAEALHADPAGLRDAPEPLPSLLDEVARVTMVGALSAGEGELPDPVQRVTGRKEEQVRALVGVAAANLPDADPIVDWCCGKGHLGRALSAARGVTTIGLERDRELCLLGRDLAASTPASCVFLPMDVLDRHRWPAVPPLRSAVVGLHACGALTDAAMTFALESHARACLLAPCCFHNLVGEAAFVPRSAAGRAAGIAWDAAALRLPTLEEVVASQAERRRRRRETAWRLGLDLLVREGTGIDEYTPVGPVHRGWHRQDFRSFVEEMAYTHEVRLPARWDADRAEAAGVRRAGVVAALGLVRSQLRRPVELWLVIDRALRLVDAGWDVSVGTFCAREVTPRNLAVIAWNPAARLL